MSFLGIDLIDNCIEKTKNFLFPIKKNLWLKLGLVSILAGLGQGGSNFNFNTGQNMPAEFGSWIASNLHWILIGFAGVLILGIIFALIRALFNFVLLDSVNKKQCLIKKSLSANADLALSYFGLSLLVNAIFIILIFGLLAPIFIALFNSASGSGSLVLNPYFWIILPFVLLLAIIAGILNGIIYNLVMSDMYFKRIKAFQSFKKMYSLFFKQFKEVLIYWIFKFLLGIATGIIGLIIVLIMLIIFGLTGATIFGIGFLISLISPILVIPLLLIGIPLAVMWFLLFIYATAVVLVPIPVFFTNYKLDFYKGLIKK